MNIKLSDFITRNEEPLSSEIDGERVMMSLDQGKYFGLNTVGSFIWELTESKSTFGEMLNKVEEKYDVAPEVCLKETSQFIEQLIEKKLVKIEKQ